MIKRNIFKCVDEEMLKQVQHDGKKGGHSETHLSHPELDSGPQKSKGMLKQVQHDSSSIGQMPSPVQYDNNRMEWVPTPIQHNGRRHTSLTFGRSMIEMLGVLAIIGVLSIGGLYAYRQAMMHHHVNNIKNFLNRITFMSYELWNNGQPASEYSLQETYDIFCNTYSFKNECPTGGAHGYGAATGLINNTPWRMDISKFRMVTSIFNVSTDLCKAIVSMELPKELTKLAARYGVGEARPIWDKEGLRSDCEKQEFGSMVFNWTNPLIK